ncbi:uncharacterized protein LOC114520145 isoform X2 [Dendronephthya gigantea]|uniref:uncharacterized protein LOC114520145 isoform X2 n=1 Tax=Dendronephthya gigantea TaxID=151771 RepID=UPI00106C6EEC|nr:uncharacterized protein LOC114520145 isoform X2 [Dendronephthya gigantea]
MFITVKFGDDREELFNPHCKVCSLLDNIKQRCDLLQEDEIDLSDQTGIRKNLSLTPTDYAIKHMEERDVLILVKIERFSGSLDETCVPLLHSLQGNKDFLGMVRHERDETQYQDTGHGPILSSPKCVCFFKQMCRLGLTVRSYTI